MPTAKNKAYDIQDDYDSPWKEMPYITTAITTAERIGREEGMLAEAREMVLEALDIKFNTVPRDMQSIINALNNRVLLRKLHRSVIQSKDIQEFRKIIQGIDAK